MKRWGNSLCSHKDKNAKKGDLKIDKDTVVHCPTNELAEKVLSIANNLGYCWGNGNSYNGHTQWDDYKEYTCYNLSAGLHSNYSCYLTVNYKIIPAEKFINLHCMNKNMTKKDLESGMWVKFRNGLKGLIIVGTDEIYCINKNFRLSFQNFTDNLTFPRKEWDVMDVYGDFPINDDTYLGNLPLLWGRKEHMPTIELTLEDIAKLKGCDVKQIKIVEK